MTITMMNPDFCFWLLIFQKKKKKANHIISEINNLIGDAYNNIRSSISKKGSLNEISKYEQ